MTNTDKYTPIKHYEFRSNAINFAECDALSSFHSMLETIAAKVVDMHEKAIVDAAVEYALSHGIRNLYLIDEKFVLDALKEKLIRDGYVGGESNDVNANHGDV